MPEDWIRELGGLILWEVASDDFGIAVVDRFLLRFDWVSVDVAWVHDFDRWANSVIATARSREELHRALDRSTSPSTPPRPS